MSISFRDIEEARSLLKRSHELPASEQQKLPLLVAELERRFKEEPFDAEQDYIDANSEFLVRGEVGEKAQKALQRLKAARQSESPLAAFDDIAQAKGDLDEAVRWSRLGVTPSTSSAIGRGMWQEGTLGFGDELAGIGGALMGDGYEPSRDRQRAINKAYSENFPGSYLGGQVAGGTMSAFVPMGVAVKAGLGARRMEQAAKMAAAGAATEGTRAFGAAEGDSLDQALEVPGGAAIGGVLGLMGYPLSAAARKGAQVIRKGVYATKRALSPEDRLDSAGRPELLPPVLLGRYPEMPRNKVIEALRQSGGAPGTLNPEGAKEVLDVLGDQGTLADLPGYRAAAARVVSEGGIGANQIDDYVRERAGGEVKRIREIVENVQGRDASQSLEDIFDASKDSDVLRKLISPNKQARRVMGLSAENRQRDIMRMSSMAGEKVRNVVARYGKALTQEDGFRQVKGKDGKVKMVPAFTVAPAHRLMANYNELDDRIYDLKTRLPFKVTAAQKQEIRVLEGVKQRYKNQLQEMGNGPVIDQFKNLRSVQRAFAFGQNTFNTSANTPHLRSIMTPDRLKKTLASMDADEIKAFRAGAQDQVRRVADAQVDNMAGIDYAMVNKGPARGLNNVLLRTGNIEKFEMLFGKKKAKEFMGGIRRENEFRDTFEAIASGESAGHRLAAQGNLYGVGPQIEPGVTRRAYRAIRGQELSPQDQMLLRAAQNSRLNRDIGDVLTSRGDKLGRVSGPLLREIEFRNRPDLAVRARQTFGALSVGAKPPILYQLTREDERAQ